MILLTFEIENPKGGTSRFYMFQDYSYDYDDLRKKFPILNNHVIEMTQCSVELETYHLPCNKLIHVDTGKYIEPVVNIPPSAEELEKQNVTNKSI